MYIEPLWRVDAIDLFAEAAALAAEVVKVPEAVWASDWRNKLYKAHTDTNMLTMRWTPFDPEPVFDVFDNTAATPLGGAAKAAMERIVSHIPGTILRCGVVRLRPGGQVKLHIDGGPKAELYSACHRLHLPLVTEPEVIFYYEHGDRFHMEPGRLYEINNYLTHGVAHGGKALRHHLMLDLLPQTYSGTHRITEHTDEERFLATMHRVDQRSFFAPMDEWQAVGVAERDKWVQSTRPA